MSGKAVALECEVMRNNVRVNSIHPGFVDTPALRKHIDDATKAGHGRGLAPIEPDEVAKTAVPIGVACTSEAVGATVVYLVSHPARPVTGAETPTAGGLTPPSAPQATRRPRPRPTRPSPPPAPPPPP